MPPIESIIGICHNTKPRESIILMVVGKGFVPPQKNTSTELLLTDGGTICRTQNSQNSFLQVNLSLNITRIRIDPQSPVGRSQSAISSRGLALAEGEGEHPKRQDSSES